jgi:hypothetical protein
MTPVGKNPLIDDMHSLINFAEVFPDDPLFEKRIDEETDAIFMWAHEFVRSPRYAPGSVGINPLVLRVAVGSWKIDLALLQKFHQLVEYPSPVRQAAFFMYWVVKTKPIYTVIPKDADNVSDYININERLAFNFAMSQILKIEVKGDADVFAKFVYLLYFRDVNPKHLILTLELLLKTVGLKGDLDRMSLPRSAPRLNA